MKSQKNNRLKPLGQTKRFWVVVLLGVFIMCLSSVSVFAFDFDNAKSYDTIARKITITNAFGMGSKLAEYTLNSNSEYCSNDCYAEGTVIFYSKNKLFSNANFKDKFGKQKNIISYRFMIKENGNWTEYNNKQLNAGTYEWRLEGRKAPKDAVDWIVSSMGLDFTEWMWWNNWQDWSDDFSDANLNSSLWSNINIGCAYFGAEVDAVYVREIGNHAEVYGETHGGGGTQSGAVSALFTNQDFNDGKNYKITFFLNESSSPYTSRGRTRIILFNGTEGTMPDYGWGCDWFYNLPSSGGGKHVGGQVLYSFVNTAATNAYAGIFNITIDGTSKNLILYAPNGTIMNSTILPSTSIWKVRLETSESIGGPDFSSYNLIIRNFTVLGNFPPEVTLNSPIDGYTSPLNQIAFNCTARSHPLTTTTIANISLWTNSTGTWHLNKTVAGTGITFNTAFYVNYTNGQNVLWGCQATDAENRIGWGENRTVKIDTIAPVIFLYSPIGSQGIGYVGKPLTLNWTIIDDVNSCWFDYNNTLTFLSNCRKSVV